MDTKKEQGLEAARIMRAVAEAGIMNPKAASKKMLVAATLDTAASWLMDVAGVVARDTGSDKSRTKSD